MTETALKEANILASHLLSYRVESEVWIGECRELGVSSWGDTFEEAREALQGLVLLELNTLEELWRERSNG